MAKTFKSLREAAEAGYHGKSVNIEGKGLQKVVFADKAYDKRMSELGSKKTKAPPARPASRAASPAPARPANLKTPRADRDQQSGPKAAPSKPVQEDRATRIAKPRADRDQQSGPKAAPSKKPAKARTPAKKPATQFMDFLRGGGFGGKEARRKADERQAKQNRR